MKLVDLTGVEVIGKHQLRLTFADGIIGEVDFAGKEWRGVLAPLADPEYFAKVHMDSEGGTIAWPNGVDLAPELLAEQALRRRVRSSSEAA